MTELIGHRGYSARYPENTILSFKKAIEIGCSGIELDVRLTKDNKVAVIHDRNLERTTNGKGFVSDFTLKELQKLDAGKGEIIPTLKEVLSEIADVKLLIEIKTDAVKNIDKLCTETVKSAGQRKDTFFISFSFDAIQNIKKIKPGLKTGLIFSKPLVSPEQYVRYLNALCPRIDRLDSAVSAFIKQYELDLYVWTVNTKEELKKVLQYNVTGVVSNDPGEVGGLL